MTQESYLEQLSQPALEIREGIVTAMNAAALAQLPDLACGQAAPEFLRAPLSETAQNGCFSHQGETFLFTRFSAPNHQVLLFRPGADGLTNNQLEGFSSQMRQQMALFLNRLQLLEDQDSQAYASLNHTFHQMLRLVNNLEFLSVPLEEAQASFHPTTLDLAGLCANLCRQSAPLLRKGNVELQYESTCTSFLTSGNSALLQRMLLALISNSAKAAPGGRVTVALKRQMNGVAITISNSNHQAINLSELVEKDPNSIPLPNDGAGMGLAVARRIAQLHRGTLLFRSGETGGVVSTLFLPLNIASTSLKVASPHIEQDAGISIFLLELCDLLPNEVFEGEPE